MLSLIFNLFQLKGQGFQLMPELNLFVVYSKSNYVDSKTTIEEFFSTKRDAEKFIGNIDIPHVHIFEMNSPLDFEYSLGENNEVIFTQEYAVKMLEELKELDSNLRKDLQSKSIIFTRKLIKIIYYELVSRYHF